MIYFADYACLICFSYWIIVVSGHDYTYVGCFKDQIKRTLPNFPLFDSAMSNEKCAAHCCSGSSSTSFFGTESNDECYCGNQGNTSTFVPSTTCNFPCFGNDTQICGGYWSLTIYSVECTPDVTSQPPCTLSQCACLSDQTIRMVTEKELMSKLLKLKIDILVDKKNTTFYLNTKRSATDTRTSSMALGIVGYIVIISLAVLVIMNDFSKYVLCGKHDNSEKAKLFLT